MILQVHEIFRQSFSLIGVTEMDETPTSSELSDALIAANLMLARWASQRLLCRSTTQLSFNVTYNKATYTIGPTNCDVTFPSKPIRVNSALYRDSGGTDFPVEVIDMVTYNNLGDKSQSTGPILYVYYDPGKAQQTNQSGTLNVYMAPDSPYMLTLELDTYLTEFGSLFETVTFEPVYIEAIIYNLGVRLFRKYHGIKAVIPADIIGIASESLKNLKSMNSVIPRANIELPGKALSYNIYNDGTS